MDFPIDHKGIILKVEVKGVKMYVVKGMFRCFGIRWWELLVGSDSNAWTLAQDSGGVDRDKVTESQ